MGCIVSLAHRSQDPSTHQADNRTRGGKKAASYKNAAGSAAPSMPPKLQQLSSLNATRATAAESGQQTPKLPPEQVALKAKIRTAAQAAYSEKRRGKKKWDQATAAERDLMTAAYFYSTHVPKPPKEKAKLFKQWSKEKRPAFAPAMGDSRFTFRRPMHRPGDISDDEVPPEAVSASTAAEQGE